MRNRNIAEYQKPWYKNLFGISKEIIVKSIKICSGSKEIFDSEKYFNKKTKE